MNGLGPLLSLAISLAIASLLRSRKRAGGPAAVRIAVQPAHGGLIWRAFAFLAVGILALIAAVSHDPKLAAIAGVVFCVLVVPSVVTFPLVRLGLVRPTFWLWRVMGDPFTAVETRPMAAWQGAAALLRAPDERSAARIERHLASCVEIGTRGVAASARIALARGDRERALRLYRALHGLDRSHGVPRALRREAAAFTALHAASRGDWRHIVRSPRAITTRLGRLVVLLGARLASAAPPPSWRVWLAWAVAPHRRRTRALVEAALCAEPRDPAVPVAPSLAAFAALLARPAVTLHRADVEAAVLSLDALSAAPGVDAQVQRRALALGIPLSDGVLAKVRTEAADDLVRLFVDGSLPTAWLPPGPTGDDVRERVRQERFDRLEALMDDLTRRRSGAVDLPEADEWCAWGDIRAACDDLLADASGPEERDAMVRVMNSPLTSFAVRLCNVRSRRILARHMFMFLRDLADPARASEAHGLATRNVSATRDESSRGALPTDGTPVSAPARVSWRRTWYGVAVLVAFFGWAPVVAIVDTKTPVGVLIAWAAIAAEAAAIVQVIRAAHALVDMVVTSTGLLLHTERGQFLALPDDVASVLVRGGTIRITLRRRPRWLPARVHTVASTSAHAKALGDRIAQWCARDAGAGRERVETLSASFSG